MLCPEVWNFKAPDSSFKSVKENFNQKANLDTIKNFPFAHLVNMQGEELNVLLIFFYHRFLLLYQTL